MLFRNHFSVCDVEQITQTIKTLNCLCYSHVSGTTSLYVRLSKYHRQLRLLMVCVIPVCPESLLCMLG